jgi:hypothetical protein
MLNWEREKRLWEEEQEKEWSTVLSKSSKKLIRKESSKRASFAKKIWFRSLRGNLLNPLI